MVRWEAIGPISVRLGDEGLSHDNISICRYDEDQLGKLLGDDQRYWSPIHFDLLYRSGYWIKLDFEVVNEKPWVEAVSNIRLFLEALGLFKSFLALLTVAGLCVRRVGKATGVTAHFGWENTIVGIPHYFLETTEYDGFVNLLTNYRKFWHNNKITDQADKQLKRINLARHYFAENFQTADLVERFIFLSVALEALYGEGQHELRYRYANRAALLLGDNLQRRKTVYADVQRLYKKRSDILHGGVSWSIEPKEVLIFNEIIRQTILRCLSLYTQRYTNIGKALDECMHDPDKHVKLLKDAKGLFGPVSENKEPAETARSRGWAIRK